MTKQKFKREALDLHHVGDWLASLTRERLRALLGKGVPVGESWFIDVLGAAEIDLDGIRAAMVCVSMVGGLPLSEAYQFATPKHGDKWETMPTEVATRVQDYALKTLKKCGAAAFDKAQRVWVVTPCVWVPE